MKIHLQTDDYHEEYDILYDKTWLTVIYRLIPSLVGGFFYTNQYLNN